MSELSPSGGGEGYGACGDEGAPGFVEQKQLDELNIACTAKEDSEESIPIF